LVAEWKSNGYFLHEKSGLWFPAKYSYTEYVDGKTIREQRTYEIDRKTLQVNQAVSDEEFAVTVPVGATVLDVRRGKRLNYVASNPVTLSLAEGGLDLRLKSGLRVREGLGGGSAPERLTPVGHRTAVFLLGVAGLLLFVAIPLLWRLRKRRLTGLTCLLACLAYPLCPGCSHVAEVDEGVVPSLVVEPESLDFGRVRDSDGPLALAFCIVNRGQQPVEITGIRSGCGCTVAELTDSILPSNERVEVPVKVSIRGRLGAFSNRILIDASGGGEPLVLPLRGTVVRDLWHNGQAITCSASDAVPTIETTFEVYTVDWPLVEFDCHPIEPGISVQEISRSKKGDETVIKFRLLVDAPAKQYVTSRSVTLKPLDGRVAPLTIPILCYRPDLRPSATASSQALRPDRISLGVIRHGEVCRFRVFGDSKLIPSLVLAGWEGATKGLDVQLDGAEQGSLAVALRVGMSAPLGLHDFRLRLSSPDGREYSIAVVAMVRPRETVGLRSERGWSGSGVTVARFSEATLCPGPARTAT